MKRLTVDKPVSEMSMIELAHNACYIDKNRNARYRDYSMDIDARDFIRKIYRDKNIAMPYEFWNNNDAFDEIMLANMEDGIEETDGFIALFYRNLWAMAELREHLKVYEDLEEQGLLLKLPCKVGDKIFVVGKHRVYEMEVVNIHPFGALYEDEDLKISKVFNIYLDGVSYYKHCTFYDIGKTVFLFKEEAEQALKGME